MTRFRIRIPKRLAPELSAPDVDSRRRATAAFFEHVAGRTTPELVEAVMLGLCQRVLRADFAPPVDPEAFARELTAIIEEAVSGERRRRRRARRESELTEGDLARDADPAQNAADHEAASEVVNAIKDLAPTGRAILIARLNRETFRVIGPMLFQGTDPHHAAHRAAVTMSRITEDLRKALAHRFDPDLGHPA